MNGYRGKILRVDLSAGSTSVTAIDEKLLRNFIGGAGLGVQRIHSYISQAHCAALWHPLAASQLSVRNHLKQVF